MNNVHLQALSRRDLKKITRRDLILKVTRRLIASKGLRSLKIRDVAAAANCAIGSIYNEFGDFDGLILTVNRGVVSTLDTVLGKVPKDDPVAHLHGLAQAYLGFARKHPNLLRSLFEHRMEDDRPFPDDLLRSVMRTFELMHEPMERLLPDADPIEVGLIARTMFSAVHGIIMLGLEERMVAVPPKQLQRQTTLFVDTHLVGLGIDVSLESSLSLPKGSIR
jgi:AcrR family transcriptional regulator